MTPVFVGPLSYPVTQYASYGVVGQFKIGQRWWLVIQEVASAIADTNLVTYSSDDLGLTWTRRAVGPSTHNNLAAIHYPGTGNTAVVAYQTSASDTSTEIVTLDLSGTSTWGTPVAVPFASDPDGNSLTLGFQPLLLSGGNIAYCWQTEIGVGNWTVSIAVYSGSWSSQLNVGVATANKGLRQVVIDGTGKIGLLWINRATYDHTYSLTTGLALVSETAAGNGRLEAGQEIALQNIGLYDSISDSVIFAVQRLTSDPAPPFDDLHTITLFVGTPSATPAFTSVNVYSIDEQAHPNLYLQFPWIIKTSTGFSVFIGYGDTFGLFADGNFQIIRSDATSLTGPWGAPTVIYDLHADPFPTNPYTDNLETMTVSVLADGTIGFTVGMIQVIAPATNWCGVLGFFSLAAPTPPPLSLACPAGGGSATVGVPYDKTLVPSGGTGPFTFRIVC